MYTKANVNSEHSDLNFNNTSNNSYGNEQNLRHENLLETGESENLIWVLGFVLLSVVLFVATYRFRKSRKL